MLIDVSLFHGKRYAIFNFYKATIDDILKCLSAIIYY